MGREKGTGNTPQRIIDEIAAKHRSGATLKSFCIVIYYKWSGFVVPDNIIIIPQG